jgi:hypothetical protein
MHLGHLLRSEQDRAAGESSPLLDMKDETVLRHARVLLGDAEPLGVVGPRLFGALLPAHVSASGPNSGSITSTTGTAATASTGAVTRHAPRP